MADSKKYNGSTWEHSLRKLGTSTDTITSLPADVYADGTNATVGLVGNMSQTGTPTPSSPIQPSETGDRTGNLWEGISYNVYVTFTGEYISPDNTTLSIMFKCEPNTTYTIKSLSPHGSASKWRIAVFAQLPTNGSIGTVIVNDDSLDQSTITTLTDSKYVVVYYKYSNSPQPNTFMVNSGSQPLPYEPYGYKIPISSASTTTPVYLGEVESTRNIKQLVLTGEESITPWTGAGSGYFYIYTTGIITFNASDKLWLSNQYSAKGQAESWGNYVISCNPSVQGRLVIKNTDYPTVEEFKTYLAQQYAAGTPVTVWYVLATPTTGIVNEPLRKIGDYADTVSGISIPTITGKDTFDVLTTLKPSEVSLSYTGWHDTTVKEWDGSQWQ